MYAYMKINYEFMKNEKFNIRNLIDLLAFLFAVTLLCILSGTRTSSLPAASIKEGFSISKNTDENTIIISDWIPDINTNRKPDIRLFSIDNKLNLKVTLPEITKITQQQTDKIQSDAFQKATDKPIIPSIISESPANILTEQTTISEKAVVTLPEQTDIPEKVVVTLPEQTVIPEASVILPDEPASIPDTMPEPSPDNVNDQNFSCNGFLCNASGMIIACQDDIIITDGVLCLPFDSSCTGLRADALTPLSMQIYEIYIPANIIAIEEGAFDDLTELFFIEVHPDNPVYGSDNGYLYLK